MEKVKTFLADISDLLNEKNYQKIYKKVPAFRQEKADRLKHREDQAQSVGAWYLWMKIQERHKIPQDAGQSFNLSHSGKYVLCSAGVSGERVGCDIECMRKYHEKNIFVLLNMRESGMQMKRSRRKCFTATGF